MYKYIYIYICSKPIYIQTLLYALGSFSEIPTYFFLIATSQWLEALKNMSSGRKRIIDWFYTHFISMKSLFQMLKSQFLTVNPILKTVMWLGHSIRNSNWGLYEQLPSPLPLNHWISLDGLIMESQMIIVYTCMKEQTDSCVLSM